MTDRDWKAEAELLRTQLVQCTTAMREVAGELLYWSRIPTGASAVVVNKGMCAQHAKRLNDARATSVVVPISNEYEVLMARKSQELLDCERNRQMEMDNHVRKEQELTKQYRAKCLEMLTCEGRSDQLADEIVRLRAYKKKFVKLAVAFDEESEA